MLNSHSSPEQENHVWIVAILDMNYMSVSKSDKPLFK